MRILIFSDLHSSGQALKWLDGLLSDEKIDLVLSPGDIVDRYDPNAKNFIEQLVLVCQTHKVPLRVVFGNNEGEEAIAYYEYAGISLHNKSHKFGGYTFVGIGDIESHPDRMVDPTSLPIQSNILVTHRPPIQNSEFRIKNLEFKNSPSVHIAGHLHSQGFVQKLGKTLVINTPAAFKGGAAILQLPQKSVKFILRHV